jgi:hypothetical protein
MGALAHQAPAREEAFTQELAEFIASLAECSRSLAHAHAALADRIERLLKQDPVTVPQAKLVRIELRSVARHNRREAWQHLTIALRARWLLGRLGGEFDLADLAACFEDNP